MSTPSQNGQSISTIVITVIVVGGILIGANMLRAPIEALVKNGITVKVEFQGDQLKSN